MNRRAVLIGGLAAGLAGPVSAEPRPFGRGAWRDLLAAHAGRKTIFHFWGLTCGPCLAELPDWGALMKDRDTAGMVMIAADPVPQPAEQLTAMLTRAGLSGAESWSFDGTFNDRLFFEIDPAWQGELPRTTLRAANGAEQTWTGAADFPHVRSWLDKPDT